MGSTSPHGTNFLKNQIGLFLTYSFWHDGISGRDSSRNERDDGGQDLSGDHKRHQVSHCRWRGMTGWRRDRCTRGAAHEGFVVENFSIEYDAENRVLKFGFENAVV